MIWVSFNVFELFSFAITLCNTIPLDIESASFRSQSAVHPTKYTADPSVLAHGISRIPYTDPEDETNRISESSRPKSETGVHVSSLHDYRGIPGWR
jgi:hypothetical protein